MKDFWLVTVDHPHDFEWAKTLYEDAGLEVGFENCGFGGQYHAVFLAGKKPVKYIREFKQEFIEAIN